MGMGAEAARILDQQGRYAIHEMALVPESVDEGTKTAICTDLAKAIRVNARPLTVSEWTKLLRDAGFEVEHCHTAPFHLLNPVRLVRDEGFAGALRFARNVLANPEGRRRVLQMRSVFTKYQRHLAAVAIVARKV